ncbi:TIGR01777 family oxidoreductase [Wenyingzhuangia sp. chi5]|uniref:TIGR01777 family oxidoreductase n=1 Tax=Wenyingzhuangia gilva TaxID=3057677 RepID=A0ABT8VPU5_9FLAO|nr:TIGR01777 family oxidoreductase [Wenyingzhuangia sp. chi5]MDO3693986.1 TIGR01777 family oxidoreductase [Wenyingzhuangia sp. chi5]
MKILITGGTGLVGSFLTELLLSNNMEVIVLSRSVKESKVKGLSYAVWDVAQETIDVAAICGVDHIIHLAGANIGDKRWTDKQKNLIIDSRVKTADLIYKTLKENKHQVKTFVSASGADCYGIKTTNNIYKESDNFGTDFLAKVCDAWENAANQFNHLGIRTVCLRTGVVCASKDSALQKMILPIKLCFGSPLGLGKQVMSLIHIYDLCNMYLHAINNVELQGAYNAVAVNKTNEEVTKKVAKILNKPLFMPKVPAFMLRLFFGEMASIILEGSAVDNTKIKATGFEFKYASLESVLKEAL